MAAPNIVNVATIAGITTWKAGISTLPGTPDVTVYKWNVAAGSYTTSETFDLGGLTGSTDQINGHTMDGDGNMYVIYQPTSGNKHLVKLNYVDGEEQFADALVLYFEGAYNHYRTKGPLTQEEIKYLDNYISVCTGN